jgi:hypothetical protein
MLQTIKYPKGTVFKRTHDDLQIKVAAIDGKGENSMITFFYVNEEKGPFVSSIKEVDRMVGFGSWMQLNNKR